MTGHLSIQMTGLGYEYVRCRSGSSDDTVYIHQLVAIADGKIDPERAFSSGLFHIHHDSRIPWDNRPGNLVAARRDDHDGLDHCVRADGGTL